MKLPIYRQKYGVQQKRASGVASNTAMRALDTFAGALDNFNNALQLVGEKESKRRRNSVTAQALADLNEAIDEIQRSPDWSTHTDRYEEAITTITKKAVAGLKDEREASLWERDFKPHFMKGRIKVKAQSLAMLKENISADNTRDLRILANAASFAQDPMDKSIIVDHGRQLLQQQLDDGLLSPTEHESIESSFFKDVSVANLRALIRERPTEAVKQLQDPETREFDHFSAAERQVWVDQAIQAYEHQLKQQEIEEARTERLTLKAEQDLQKSLSKQADMMAAEGQLTAGWLYENADFMSKSDFRYHLERLGSDNEEHNNDLAYIRLSDRAMEGDDIREEANVAMLYGDLSKDRRDRLHSIVDGRTGKTKPWSATLRSFINNYFGSDEILKAIPGGAQRKAEALFEWDKWIHDNIDQADMVTGEEMARNIIQSWQWKPVILDFFTKQRLRYGPDILTPDIDLSEVARRTQDAYERGEISTEIYKQEVKKIKILNEAKNKVDTNE